MDAERTTILVEAARLYYEHGLSQQQIARRLGVSRPGVSRMLQTARNQGIVMITINDPTTSGTRLEQQLIEQFGLREAVVVPGESGNYRQVQKRLGQAAAQMLDRLANDGLTIAVSWGTTMQAVAGSVGDRQQKNMTVVQLNGGISRAEFDTHASEIAKEISKKYGAIPYLLPLPAIVDSKTVKDAITSDRNIGRTLELARQATVAMFTIGSFGRHSVLVKAEYFDDVEVDQLLADGAVGDICSRIIDKSGKICSNSLNQRTIGIELNEINTKSWSIAVAGGERKLAAIRAGLQGKLFNTLITDEWVATRLLSAD